MKITKREKIGGFGAVSELGTAGDIKNIILALLRVFEIVEEVAGMGLHTIPEGECRCSRCDLVRRAKALVK